MIYSHRTFGRGMLMKIKYLWPIFLCTLLCGCTLSAPFMEVDYTSQFSDYVKAQSYEEPLKDCINKSIKVDSVSDTESTFTCTWYVPDVNSCVNALVLDTGLGTELKNTDDVHGTLESALCTAISSGMMSMESETFSPLYINNNWDYSQQLNSVYDRFTQALSEMEESVADGAFSQLKVSNVMKQHHAFSAFVYTEFDIKYLVSDIQIRTGEEAVKSINDLSSLNNVSGADYIFISYNVTCLSAEDGVAYNHFILGNDKDEIAYPAPDGIVGLTEKLNCSSGETVTLTTVLQGPADANLYFTSENISNNLQVVY